MAYDSLFEVSHAESMENQKVYSTLLRVFLMEFLMRKVCSLPHTCIPRDYEAI
jgi:hypothetical protein